MSCNSDNTCFSSAVAERSEGTEVAGTMEFVLLPDSVQPAEASDAEEAREELHPTADKAAKSKTDRVGRFFRAAWKAIKPFKKNKVKPFVPPAQTDAESPGPEMKADVSLAVSKTEATKPDDTDLDSLNPNAGGISETKTDAKSKQEVNNHLVPVLNDYLYDTSKMLGEGAFAKVYEGFRKSDGKKVAVKVMNRGPCVMSRTLALDNHHYPSEVALMLMLQRAPVHPNIIQMYDWCDNGETLTLVLEFPHPCVALCDLICRQDKLSESQAHHLWVQAVRAVHHCLKQGVNHSDINPGNILVNTDTLEVKLIDFGTGNIIRGPNQPLTGDFGCQEYEATSRSVRMLGYVLHVMVHGYPFLSYDNVQNTHTNISSGPGVPGPGRRLCRTPRGSGAA